MSGSVRSVAYVREAPAGFSAGVSEAREARLYLVQETGPTSFVLKEEISATEASSTSSSSSAAASTSATAVGLGEGSRLWRKPKVMIGERHVCSSCRSKCTTAAGIPCRHVLFVLLKVLRVPEANPIAWQGGLTEAEIQEALRCRRTTLFDARKGAADASATAGGADAGKVAGAGAGSKRRSIAVGDDECPICQEHVLPVDADLDEVEVVGVRKSEGGQLAVDVAVDDVEKVVFCVHGCGNNMHRRCMRIWTGHQASTGKAVTCPLCRSEWDSDEAESLAKPRATPALKRDVRQRRAKARMTLMRLAGLLESQEANGKVDTEGGPDGVAGERHPGVRCRGCGTCPVQGNRYVCCACSLDTQSYDLCTACFCQGQYHRDRHHPFMVMEAPGAETLPVDRPLAAAPKVDDAQKIDPRPVKEKPKDSKPREKKADLYLPDLDGLDLDRDVDFLSVGGVGVGHQPPPSDQPRGSIVPRGAGALRGTSRTATPGERPAVEAANQGRTLADRHLRGGARPGRRPKTVVSGPKPRASGSSGGENDEAAAMGLFIGSAVAAKPEPHMPRLAQTQRRRGFAPLHPPSYRPGGEPLSRG